MIVKEKLSVLPPAGSYQLDDLMLWVCFGIPP